MTGQSTGIAARPLGMRGRVAVGMLCVLGVVASAPSGFGVLWFVPYAAVGAVLMIRRPRTSVGWFLFALGWSLAFAATSVDATAEEFAGGTVPVPLALLAVVPWGSIGFYLFAVLAITFPSGRIPAGRWGRPSRLALGFNLAIILASLGMPIVSANLAGSPTSVPVANPFALFPDLPVWQVLTPDNAVLPIIALVVAAAVSVVVRVRRAGGVERQQLRWFAASLAFVVTAVLFGFALGSVVPDTAESGLAWIPAIVAFPIVPISIGIAVTRYRLYEIDRIVSRTIGWALVTGVLVAIFAGGVVALQALLSGFTQGETLAVAASTLVAFALFQPVRRRVQAAVDRRFDRGRYDGERTVAAFAERLRHQVDLAEVEADVVRTIGSALRPASTRMWLRSPSRDHPNPTAP
jgi:hypothetical protein